MLSTTEADLAILLPTYIYQFRIYLGMTQQEFADLMGTSASSIHKYEYGIQRPSGSGLALLARLAEQYGYEAPPEVSTRRGPSPRKE